MPRVSGGAGASPVAIVANPTAREEARAAFRAAGDVGRAMLPRLAALLDRYAALPRDGSPAFIALADRYLALRYGPLPRPLPPGLWPWALSLRGAHLAAYPAALAALTASGGGDAAALWRWGWPQDEEDALDERAGALGIDRRVLLARQEAARASRSAARQALPRRKRGAA